MTVYADNIVDQYNRPVEGAEVTVWLQDRSALASLEDSGGSPISNPVLTDVDGGFSFYTDDGVYSLDVAYGGRLRYRDQVIQVGLGIPLPDAVLLALSDNGGAALVGWGASDVGGYLDEGIHLIKYGTTFTAFSLAAAAAMAAGKALILPAQEITLTGLAAPIVTTSPLRIIGYGNGLTKLTASSPAASLFHVLHDFEIEGVTFSGFSATTSGNGGSIIYSLNSTDSGITPVRISVHNCGFLNCKAPINIESPFDRVIIDKCRFETTVGYPIRLGTSGLPAQWGTWVGVSITDVEIDGVTATGATQNVGGIIAYGTDPEIRSARITNVVGGGAGSSEAWGIHTQAIGTIVDSCVISAISGGALSNRCISYKGETDARMAIFSNNKMYCGGTSEGLAWYGGEGIMSDCIVDDPLSSGITVGSASGSGKSKIVDTLIFGTSRASTKGISATLDDGIFEIEGVGIHGFADKPIAIDARTGIEHIVVRDLTVTGCAAPVEIYTTNLLPELTVEGGSYTLTNSSYCLQITGPGGITNARVTLSSAKSSGGFGVRYNTAIGSLKHRSVECVGMGAGREVAFDVTPTDMDFEQAYAATTTNATALNVVTYTPPTGASSLVRVSASGKSSADQGVYIRSKGQTSAAGTAAAVGSMSSTHTGESAGAAAWEVDITESGATGLVRVTGAAATTINWQVKAEILQSA